MNRAIGRTAIVLLSLALVGAGAVAVIKATSSSQPAPTCQVTAGAAPFSLDVDQAANAATIAAVGKRLGLPDHAATVALAAALQESKLHNLSHGDRDSVGLFQQRPSQGWGAPSQLISPIYAATAFYQRLAQLSNWQTLAVTDAAQAVQHSAAPDAYAQWEAEARALAKALTGEVAAGLTCRFAANPSVPVDPTLAGQMAQELGTPGLGAVVPVARGWAIASWLVTHALALHITSVAFDGKRWTPAGTWLSDPSGGPAVTIGPAA